MSGHFPGAGSKRLLRRRRESDRWPVDPGREHHFTPVRMLAGNVTPPLALPVIDLRHRVHARGGQWRIPAAGHFPMPWIAFDSCCQKDVPPTAYPIKGKNRAALLRLKRRRMEESLITRGEGNRAIRESGTFAEVSLSP